MKHLILLLIIMTGILVSNSVIAKKVRIDQVPMYGGMDRSAVPKLNKGDAKFIAKVTKEYGTRNLAAKAWVDQGFKFFEMKNYKKAMQRFNQAWLLDPDYADVYWGFSAVLYDKGDNCGSMRIAEKALEGRISSMIPPSQMMFFADLGMITSICAMDEKTDHNEKLILIKKADELFIRSEKKFPGPHLNAYLYDKWWQGLYWRGEYAKAWEKVFLMRDNGGEADRDYLRDLKRKMREPNK